MPMSIKLIYFVHGTTTDNEQGISTGWNEGELSELGEKQSKELAAQIKDGKFDAIFCSDLQRSYKTAEIAFEGRDLKIIKDKRLRECNYGDLTRHISEEVEAEKENRIIVPFPNGESYEQTAERMRNFLEDLLKNYNGKKVMIIGHRATQYGLEYWIKGVQIKEAVIAPWKWQPGWVYEFKKLK